ncbi:hypothetical protein PILCRDRAFT_726746 [Piloderma croceum F 1598]|uniref:Uncharacterized protein n=1 Tax=Piloderma croceum (strain F 1598) TaxID=765440 RepID=A0A0C3F0M0_PILCF|nr:hypothetical protein PILCRDRAFT_726746 [Piloderma croceum F 1598]
MSYQPLELVEMYLARSQERFLDIDLELDPSAESIEEDGSLVPSPTALIAHTDRWRSFLVGFCLDSARFSQSSTVYLFQTSYVLGYTHP